MVVPQTLPKTQDLELHWTPDANAETMGIGILDTLTGASIGCTVPDSAGTVEVDTSLLAGLSSGVPCEVTALRIASRTTQTENGPFQLSSYGTETVVVLPE